MLQKGKDSSFGEGTQTSPPVRGLLGRNWWAEIHSAVGSLGGSRLAGWGLTGGWAGGFGLRGLAGVVLGDFRLAGSGVSAVHCCAGSGLLAIFSFAGGRTRQAGAHGAVGDGSDIGRAAQDGVPRAVAGGAVGDGCHIRLPVGEGPRVDRAVDGAVGERSGARRFAGAGYVESPRASRLADGRGRRPLAAAGRLAGSRWAGDRLTADGLTALDDVASRLAWTGHTDTW